MAEKSKNKIFIILTAALLGIAALGGALSYFFLSPAENEKSPVLAAARVEPPSFMNIEPFVVNLADEDKERYLQVSIVFEVRGEEALKALRRIEPMIRSRTLLVLANKTSSNLKTNEGKENLKAEMMDLVFVSLDDSGFKEMKSRVSDAHFSTFVIQ